VAGFSGSREEKRALGAYVKLMRAAETVTANAQRHFARIGLTTSQFGVLEALYHLGPLYQRDLARKILKSSGNLTTVIDNLEKRGLVQRRQSAEDRRFVAVHLTEAGERLIRESFPRHAAGIVAELGVLTPAEQEELGRLCRKLGRKKG
jgi:MarR family 2-MHQ and catechol resistance regulon transcriptional repressor